MSETKKITTNFIWRFLERFGAQAITLLVSIILARLLDPAVYGTISLILVFTTILQVFVDSGLGTALIQKKDADDLDFSSVFFFNVLLCVILYTLMYFMAPFIARFYNDQSLTSLLRVLSLVVLISGVKNVQQAFVTRNLLFKKFFFATLTGTVCAAIVGVFMAYKGYGVWALVMQNIVNQAIDTLMLWILVGWKPKFIFSVKRLTSLISFGWKLLLSSLIETVYKDLRSLIIGKIYTKSDLAFYTQGDKYPNALVSIISSSIDSVLLPTMSSEQDNRDRVKSMTRRAISISTYVIMPLMAGVVACAEPIVSLILTDKWLPCVPFLRIFCVTYAFFPIHTANLNAIKALGRSDIFLLLEILKKSVGIILLVISMNYGVLAIAYSMLVFEVFGQIINTWPNRRLLNYGYLSQIKDIMPQICLSIVMGLIVYCISFLELSNLLTLVIQIPLGVFVYVVLSILFKIDCYPYLLKVVKELLPQKD